MAEINKALQEALTDFLAAVRERGLTLPIAVRCLDSRWAPIQSFTLQRNGKIVRSYRHQRRAPGIRSNSLAFPLKIVGTDHNGRMARMRIDANGVAEKTEFLN